MTSLDHEKLITIIYRDQTFSFAVSESTEDSLRGRFRWTEEEKAELLALLEQEEEEGKQPWYLDDDGYRLDDLKLFQMSPWTTVDGETRRKAVPRTMNYLTGEARFALTPWFRIGDELNRHPSKQ